MNLEDILDRRLLIISGKGGVGKTTVAAALGVLASRYRRRVLVCEVEGKRALSDLFDAPELTGEPRELRPRLYGMNISPEEALEEYFAVNFKMPRIARPLVSSQLVYYVTHAAPGLRDILMLGKVWHDATRKKEFDLIVLDTPAAGHAVSMLRSPSGFLQAVSVGPLAKHARAVAEWLTDPTQVSIHLVTLPEEMPVNETIETTRMLEEKMGMDVHSVFVNMNFRDVFGPEQADRIANLKADALAKESGNALNTDQASGLLRNGQFYLNRMNLQASHRSDLYESLSSTANFVDLPYLFTESFGPAEIDALAEEMEAQLAS